MHLILVSSFFSRRTQILPCLSGPASGAIGSEFRTPSVIITLSGSGGGLPLSGSRLNGSVPEELLPRLSRKETDFLFLIYLNTLRVRQTFSSTLGPFVLHIRCGDDILSRLRTSSVIPGECIRWADPVCQGPTPCDLTYEQWISVRSQFLSGHYEMSFHDAQKFLTQQDKALETARDHEKTILWFEHDLFDQSILIFLLNRFAQSAIDKSRIYLLSIDHFEGIDRFTGLGMLSAEQLESLYGSERIVSPDQWKEAERAWNAFSSPDPVSLLEFLHDSTDALPFLRKALVRHLQEFPSRANGLNATERMTLEILVRHSVPPLQLFREFTESEEHPWLGDTMFWPFLRRMATGKHPLLVTDPVIDPRRVNGSFTVQLKPTETAHRVAANEVDNVQLNGIDRWVGGVRLNSQGKTWRWNAKTFELTLS
jgi:hypothetical protein